MGVRFHRSKQILPGVRLNFSKSGIGISLGKKGMRYSIGPKGDRMTLGIPGTGLSYTTTSSGKSRRSKEVEEEQPVYIPQSTSLTHNPELMIEKLSGMDPNEIMKNSNMMLLIGITIGIFLDLYMIFLYFSE